MNKLLKVLMTVQSSLKALTIIVRIHISLHISTIFSKWAACVPYGATTRLPEEIPPAIRSL